ncbi:uncharacterized protein LOC129912320 [Episyrphus balteatus]|uniref:uncharacterized protein LOC129912320 n=1 Tax=Episyrphus balteatus TaxID=286459 RepID=UPI0024862DEC|nr:uncharacterized protein LOC129912320 [Episyrphus balteatus]
MKSHLSFLAFLVSIIFFADITFAAKQPLCTYKNTGGETVFLTYMPLSKKGEEYIDFNNAGNGMCVKKATCLDDFSTKVEDCSSVKITCTNRRQFQGVFPSCCIKC